MTYLNKIIIVVILCVFLFIISYSGYTIYNIRGTSALKTMVNETTRDISDNDIKSPEQQIPKIIIQTWKDNNIPEKYNDDIASVKKYNPDYQYIFFTDDDIEKFLKENYPPYYETYKKLPIKIQKIDFFRYIAVYHYGGFYLDLDIKVSKNFDDMLNYSCVFPIDTFIYCTCKHRFKKILNKMFIENCEHTRFKHLHDKNCKILLGQYAFGAKKNHLFLKYLINTIHHNIDNSIQIYNEIQNKKLNEFLLKKSNEYYVYFTTGPDFVTSIYLDYIKNYDNDIKILFYPKKQTLGEYGKHNCYGVWKI